MTQETLTKLLKRVMAIEQKELRNEFEALIRNFCIQKNLTLDEADKVVDVVKLIQEMIKVNYGSLKSYHQAVSASECKITDLPKDHFAVFARMERQLPIFNEYLKISGHQLTVVKIKKSQ